MDVPAIPKFELELDIAMFALYDDEMTALTLKTMKHILKHLYGDKIDTFEAKERILLEALRARNLV